MGAANDTWSPIYPLDLSSLPWTPIRLPTPEEMLDIHRTVNRLYRKIRRVQKKRLVKKLQKRQRRYDHQKRKQ